jgi:integrase/recombinase XerC
MYNDIITTNAAAVTLQDLEAGNIESFCRYMDVEEKTAKSYKDAVKSFLAYIRYRNITSPTRDTVREWRSWLLSEHEAIIMDGTGWNYRRNKDGQKIILTCKATTAALYFRGLRSFFKWAAAVGIYENIADGLKAPRVDTSNHRKEALEAKDVAAIEKSMKAHSAQRGEAITGKDAEGRKQRNSEQGARDFAMFTIAVNVGLRTVELSRANVGDLKVIGGQPFIYIQGKGHHEKDARKPLAPEVYKTLKDYLEMRGAVSSNAPLFAATGNRSGGKRIQPGTIGKMLKKVMVEAGYNCEELTAHSLRHTAGTAAVELTDIYTAKNYLRHQSVSTTEIYTHKSTEREEAATAEKIFAYYHEERASA